LNYVQLGQAGFSPDKILLVVMSYQPALAFAFAGDGDSLPDGKDAQYPQRHFN
jgi:hypothetical protein